MNLRELRDTLFSEMQNVKNTGYMSPDYFAAYMAGVFVGLEKCGCMDDLDMADYSAITDYLKRLNRLYLCWLVENKHKN